MIVKLDKQLLVTNHFGSPRIPVNAVTSTAPAIIPLASS
jgi:hypothetical protein